MSLIESAVSFIQMEVSLYVCMYQLHRECFVVVETWGFGTHCVLLSSYLPTSPVDSERREMGGGREGGREGGSEGVGGRGSEGVREGVREGVSEGVRERGREGGSEGVREGGRE